MRIEQFLLIVTLVRNYYLLEIINIKTDTYLFIY